MTCIYCGASKTWNDDAEQYECSDKANCYKNARAERETKRMNDERNLEEYYGAIRN